MSAEINLCSTLAWQIMAGLFLKGSFLYVDY